MSTRHTRFWHDACVRAEDATLDQINTWYRAVGHPGFNRLEDAPRLPTADDYMPSPKRSASRKTCTLLANAIRVRAELGMPPIDLT